MALGMYSGDYHSDESSAEFSYRMQIERLTNEKKEMLEVLKICFDNNFVLHDQNKKFCLDKLKSILERENIL